MKPHPRPKLKTLGQTDDFLLDDIDTKADTEAGPVNSVSII